MLLVVHLLVAQVTTGKLLIIEYSRRPFGAVGRAYGPLELYNILISTAALIDSLPKDNVISNGLH